LEYETLYGTSEIVVNRFGEKQTLLAGDSKEKIESLWKETIQQINLLRARPQQEREGALRSIQVIESTTITYLEQVTSPYSLGAIQELYQSSKYYYLVDIKTSEITEITLINDRDYNTSPAYDQEQLEKMAKSFISKVANNVDLLSLSLEVGKKDENFFFRWSDPETNLAGGLPAFIQVGFASSGDFLNY
jgi:hypothetical protein